MKWFNLLITSAFWLISGNVTLQAAMRYWDTNGPAPGASSTPFGSWDSDQFWSTSAEGTVATSGWVNGDTAVFSAGNDAINAFTVTVDGNVEAGGVTFEEGFATITGGGWITMTNAFEFPIVTMTNAAITLPLSDLYGTCGLKKMGPGTLSLQGFSTFGWAGFTNTIAEGILVFSNSTALGSGYPALTIVSNGASLQLGIGISVDMPVALMGTGVSNSGALRYYHYNHDLYYWYAGLQLWGDATIVHDGPGQWRWDRDNIQGNGFDLTIGGNGGGTLRLNMNQPYNVAIDLGTNVLTKEGNFTLQFENPNRFSELRFNGGTIYPRNISYLGNTSATPILVGAGCNAMFQSLFQNCGLVQPLILNEGANLGFDCRLYNGNYLQFAYSGVISGPGNLYQTNPGSLLLSAANTYTGTTTVKGGSLILGPNGSITNSSVIDLQSNATFNVSGVVGGYVLAEAQNLQGEGLITGNVEARGTLSPGNGIGSLFFDTNLTLTAGANLLLEVDKTASPANDSITVLNTLSSSSTGTVTVVNLGAIPLATNDTFQIFNQPVANGQALKVVSAGGGILWSNRLAYDGSITVLGLLPTIPPSNLTIAAAGPTSFQLRAQGGPSQPYAVYAYTNVAAALMNWWSLGTVYADSGGVIQFVDTLATNQQRFYRLATAP